MAGNDRRVMIIAFASTRAKWKGLGGLSSHSILPSHFLSCIILRFYIRRLLYYILALKSITLDLMTSFAFLLLTFRPIVALSFPDRYLVHAREPMITQAPQLEDHPLFARGDVSTCGFVSGDANSPLTCPTSYSCTSTVQDLIGWACCNQIQCAGNYRTCVNYGAQLCNGLDNADCSSIYTSILSW